MIIDSDYDSSAIVITGSQNWSNNGELYNDENTLIIHSADIVNQYLQEFAERYREAGGEYVSCSERKKIVNLNKIKVFPNPFTTATTITLYHSSKEQRTGGIELKIYDLSGRLVKDFSLGTGHLSLGTDFKAGIYFLRSERINAVKVIKLR